MPSSMIYGELLRSGERSSEPYVVDRGIFFSIEEFAPYRKRGWSSTGENNAAADAALEANGAGHPGPNDGPTALEEK